MTHNDTYPPVGVHLSGDLDNNPPIHDDHPTLGFRLNHCMLRIRDPKATLHFYIDLMGMRTIFTLNTGPFTVFCLGYPQTPAHRADPAAYSREVQSPSVMSRTSGLLELSHCHASEDQPETYIANGYKPPHLGFNHLGFTVPNPGTVTKRLREEGVRIVKDVGEGPNDLIPTTKWEREEKGIATADLHPGFTHILRQIAFVEDPVCVLRS